MERTFAILERINNFFAFLERVNLPFIFLFVTSCIQLWMDASDPESLRGSGVADYETSQIIYAYVFLLGMIYQVWKRSDYQFRTVVAAFLAGNISTDVWMFTTGNLSQRGPYVIIDVLWLIGLLLLRFGQTTGPKRGWITIREF